MDKDSFAEFVQRVISNSLRVQQLQWDIEIREKERKSEKRRYIISMVILSLLVVIMAILPLFRTRNISCVEFEKLNTWEQMVFYNHPLDNPCDSLFRK